MKKQIKRCKRNISLKGGTGNKVTYKHNGREIILIGVNHLERGITMNDMREIVEMGNKKRNVCYYIEFDKRLTKKQTLGKIPKTGELTTKIIMPYLKREFKHIWNNMCIKGWDVRQTLINQSNQDILYSNHIYNQTLDYIKINYIKKLPVEFDLDLRNYTDDIGNFLQKKLNDKETYFRLRTIDPNDSLFNWLCFETHKYVKHFNLPKHWANYTIREIINFPELKTEIQNIENFIFNLRKSFSNYSDLDLLKNILDKNNKKTYIIFQGLEHYNNVKNHMKDLKIK